MQLAFTPRPSRSVARLLAGLHAGLAVLWCAVTPPPLMTLAGLVLIGLGWCAARHEINGLARSRIVAVTETPGSRYPWRLEAEDGGVHGAIMIARGIVCPWLIVVSLVSVSRRYVCVLDAENVPPDVHRQLRIKLRAARARPATSA